MVLALVLLPAFAEVLGSRRDAGAVRRWRALLAIELILTLARSGSSPRWRSCSGPGRALDADPGGAHRLARTVHACRCSPLALGIAYGSAEIFGVSFALGAFFAGVVLSESQLQPQGGGGIAAAAGRLLGAVLRLGRHAVRSLDPGREPARGAWRAGADHGRQVADRLRHRAAAALSGGHGPDGVGRASRRSASSPSSWSGSASRSACCRREGRDLVLAGALLSITLNPLAFMARGRDAAHGSASPAGGDRVLRSGALRRRWSANSTTSRRAARSAKAGASAQDPGAARDVSRCCR